MAAKVRIELDHGGIKELLSSAPVAAECESAAQKLAATAGEGFEVLPLREMGFGGGRVGYAVWTATFPAKRAESEDKVLSQAVSACSS